MNCNEFTKRVEDLTLADLSRSANEQWLSHGRACAACSSRLQQKQQLAGAMLTLRNSTAMLQAPIQVEQHVLRAFRSSARIAPAVEFKTQPQPFAFRLSRFFEWGAYAAVAAALAISLGLGFWLWQHSSQTAPQSAQAQKTTTEQPVPHEVAQPKVTAQVPETDTAKPVAAGLKSESRPADKSRGSAATTQAASSQSLAQAAQAQGYTPLMLCDPISCSGDEQVVRMELPAGADGSTGTQMADVVVGDDGLVRAIRIVQQ